MRDHFPCQEITCTSIPEEENDLCGFHAEAEEDGVIIVRKPRLGRPRNTPQQDALAAARVLAAKAAAEARRITESL